MQFWEPSHQVYRTMQVQAFVTRSQTMEYTEDQKARFIEDFKVIKRRQIMVAVLFVPFTLLFILFAASADPKTGEAFGISMFVFIPIHAIALTALVIFSLKNWRCPACDRYLGKEFNPSFCPKCGEEIQL